MTLPVCGLCIPHARPRVKPWVPQPSEVCRDHRELVTQLHAALDWNARLLTLKGDDPLERALRMKNKSRRKKALAALRKEYAR